MTDLAAAAPFHLTEETVKNSLRQVYDPEIPVNVVDLGLVYGIEIAGADVHVKMTLTARGCPVWKQVEESARDAIEGIAGVGNVAVEFVFDPPWSPERMTPEAREQLGI
jgi:metal-sulfur cluster biosynthetic enzyme